MKMSDEFEKNSQVISDKIKSELLLQMGALKQVGMENTPQYKELEEQYNKFDNGATLFEVIGEEFGDMFNNLVRKMDDDIEESIERDKEIFK